MPLLSHEQLVLFDPNGIPSVYGTHTSILPHQVKRGWRSATFFRFKGKIPQIRKHLEFRSWWSLIFFLPSLVASIVPLVSIRSESSLCGYGTNAALGSVRSRLIPISLSICSSC